MSEEMPLTASQNLLFEAAGVVAPAVPAASAAVNGSVRQTSATAKSLFTWTLPVGVGQP